MLDEDMKSEVNLSQFMQNADQSEIVLLGCYRSLMKDELYGWNLSLLIPNGTDLLQVGLAKSSNYREVPNNVHSSSNSYILETWSQLYKGIYDANIFIETALKNKQSFSEADEQMTDIYIAEAKVLRALYNFELVRYFGNIALMKSSSDSYIPSSKQIQSPVEEVYKFIEQDLLDALILPWSTDDNIRKNSTYRMSRGSAYGLLAKLYATWAGYPLNDVSKWERAAWAAEMIVNSGKHSLLSDYETLWENTCNGIWDPQESLMEVSFYDPVGTSSSDPTGRIGKFNGVRVDEIKGVRNTNVAECYVPYPFVESLYKEYDKNKTDVRYELSIAYYEYSGMNKKNLSSKSISNAKSDSKTGVNVDLLNGMW
jgi:hypothetical protein